MDGTISTTDLTLSDLVLLRAEELVKPAKVFGIKLFGSETKLDLDELVRVMFTAAFLSLEQGGAARLETRTGSELFGLRHPRKLYFEPTGTGATPSNGLESSLLQVAARLAPKHQNTIRGVVYAWMGQDVTNPRYTAVGWVEAQLAKRGLLDVTEGKLLGLIKQLHYTVPERTRALAAGQSLDPLRQLLDSTRQNRSSEWKQLRDAVDQAMAERKIQTEINTPG